LSQSSFAIGVDLGGQSAKLGLVDTAGRLLAAHRQTVDANAPKATIQHQLVRAIKAIHRQAEHAGHAASAVGIALPGYMDHARKRLLHAANLPTLGGTDFLQSVRQAVALPVTFDSDANAAAFGEYRFGAGQGVARLIVTTIGTGVGAGVVIDGRLLRIWRHIAGSLGHVIVNPNGPRCACGARGCVEALASGGALERRAREMAETRPNSILARLWTETGRLTGVEVGRALAEGDANAADLVREIGWWLGVAIASWSVIYRPQRVLVGGGIACLGTPLIEAARKGIHAVGQPDATAELDINTAALGPDAGIIGAAALAMQSGPSISNTSAPDTEAPQPPHPL
jgi:glucokinase